MGDQKLTGISAKDKRVYLKDSQTIKDKLLNIDTVIFDLDDLLYSFTSDDPNKKSIYLQMNDKIKHYYMNELNLSEEAADRLQNELYVKHGTNMRGCVVEKQGSVAKLVDAMHNTTGSDGLDLSVIAPNPELAKLFKQMKEGGLRVLIFSNGQENPYINKVLNQIGIDPKDVDGIYGANETNYKHPKPHGRAFEIFCEKFNIIPKRTMMFEDSHKNLETAKKARKLQWGEMKGFALTALRLYPSSKHFYMFSEEAQKTGVPSNEELLKVMNKMPDVDIAGFEITSMIKKVLPNISQKYRVKTPLIKPEKETQPVYDEIDYDTASHFALNPHKEHIKAITVSSQMPSTVAVAPIFANIFNQHTR